MKLFFKLFATYLFFFPGLILHEGAHALATILTFSKITKISLIPSIRQIGNNRYSVTYGFVESAARYRVVFMFIGIAPFMLWLIPFMIAFYFGWVNIETSDIYWSLILLPKNWWFFFLLSQICWAGFPSRQDWNVFMFGFFSISSALSFTAIYTLYAVITKTA